jgi:protoheme IX farnesyltransferase
MIAHSWAMVACSLVLVRVGGMGWLYASAAVVLGAMFLREVHLLRRRVLAGQDPRSMRLFHLSITYLSLLSLAVIADVVVHVAL